MLIKVKVYPNSKSEEIKEKAKDRLEIKVKEKPENSLANEKVREVLAGYFGFEKSKIRLIRGAKQRNKIYEIPG